MLNLHQKKIRSTLNFEIPNQNFFPPYSVKLFLGEKSQTHSNSKTKCARAKIPMGLFKPSPALPDRIGLKKNKNALLNPFKQFIVNNHIEPYQSCIFLSW